MPETRRPLREPRRARARDHGRLQAPRRLHGDREGLPLDGAGGPDLPDRGVRPQGPRGRRILDGQEGLVPAARRHGEVPLLQRRRVRARHLQGPRAHVQEPARAGRGHRDLGARRRRVLRLHLHPRRVLGGRRRPGRRRCRGLRGRVSGREHPGLRLPDRAGRPPRRRRLHLRRGDRAPRLARGQARKPAPEAAVPRDPGPLRRADADQQRRDADERAADRHQRIPVVQDDGHRAVHGHEGRLRLGLREAPRQLRDRAGHPLARDHLRPRGRPAARAAR